MGAHGWVAGICQPWGQFFYLGAGWPQWKPLGIPGTHLPLKRGSWLKDQMEYSSLTVSNLVHLADFKLQTSITPELYIYQ